MFVAKCKPLSYKVAPGDYAIDANGEIAVAFNYFYMIPAGRGQWIDDCNVAYRSVIGDCTTSSVERNDKFKTSSFQAVKYIARADIIAHFNMNVIYNYRTYTQAFYDIFTLNGDDIILKNQSSSSTNL